MLNCMFISINNTIKTFLTRKQAVGFASNRLSRIVTSTYQGDYTINDNQKFNPNSIKGSGRSMGLTDGVPIVFIDYYDFI